MELFSGLEDIATTPDGDIIIENGDIKMVSGIDWFIQEVNKILRSGVDWYFAPNAGVDLEQFYGRVNSAELGRQIEELVKTKITRQNLNYPADLSVKVVPISISELKLYITLIFDRQTVSVTKMIYNLQNGLMKSTEDDVNQSNIIPPNKHPFASRVI